VALTPTRIRHLHDVRAGWRDGHSSWSKPPGRNTTKTTIALALPGAALLTAPATALAKAPVKTPPPPGPYTFQIGADETPCGAFTVIAHGGETDTTHFDRFGEVSVVRPCRQRLIVNP
jgi:hypothetical protein